jgi:hypothetical protein
MSTLNDRKTRLRRLIQSATQKALDESARRPGAAAALADAGADLEARRAAGDVPLLLPDAVVDWLARLALFYGVPLEYLIPDGRLLPAESLRFFYVDPNWILRALDGAMSIGTSSTKDNVFNHTFYAKVYDAVAKAVPKVRQDLRGVGQPGSITEGATWSGMLMRSSVVSGYPGLEVIPTRDGAEVPIMRMDRVGAGILLCIFNGVPDKIELKQPPEGLHFGIRPEQDGFMILLRWVGHSGLPKDNPGEQIANPKTSQKLSTTGKMRPDNAAGKWPTDGVVDVRATAKAITDYFASVAPEFGGHNPIGEDAVFTSAEFALQMVKSAGIQPYSIHPTGRNQPLP